MTGPLLVTAATTSSSTWSFEVFDTTTTQGWCVKREREREREKERERKRKRERERDVGNNISTKATMNDYPHGTFWSLYYYYKCLEHGTCFDFVFLFFLAFFLVVCVVCYTPPPWLSLDERVQGTVVRA